MQCSATFVGSALLDELRTIDRMEPAGARGWVARKTGRGFDPQAMYELQWQDSEDSPTWSGYLDLQVHIMTDRELLDLENDYRHRHHLPNRRPWERPMFEASMGRSGSSN